MEKKLEILLVEDDSAICEEMSEMISDTDDMILINYTNNATKAIEYVKSYLPDVVILDLELHRGGGTGFDVLYALQSLSLPRMPFLLITTNNSSSKTHAIVRELGADFIMSKHQENYSTKSVLDFLRITRLTIQSTYRSSRAIQHDTPETQEQYERRMNRLIAKHLDCVGINPKLKGRQYLIDAIAIAIPKPSVPNVCTVVADKHKKTKASVERAMQNAIASAWKNSDPQDLLKHYTATIDHTKGSPTLTEFIYYYAHEIRNQY